jgi:hypothetical protein
MKWRSNIKSLFNEVLNNPGTAAAKIPLQITLNIIAEAAMYAAKTKDDKMISYFVALGIYEFSDPYSEHYDEKRSSEYLKIYDELKKIKNE